MSSEFDKPIIFTVSLTRVTLTYSKFLIIFLLYTINMMKELQEKTVTSLTNNIER